MKLPVIKDVVGFIEENDEDYVLEAIDVLEHLSQSKGIKENELEVMGELLSNMYGGLEVAKQTKNGVNKKDALNDFMKRVMGSIDK